MDVCLVLYGMLEKLCSNGSIRQWLAKVSAMDVSIADITVASIGTAQRQLADHLGHSTVLSRIAFVLILFAQPSNGFVFPSEQVSQLLLLALLTFGEAVLHCSHCIGELRQTPSSVLGRLCRSTATALPRTACITLCLYMAVTAPIAISVGDHLCGIIRDSCCAGATDGRVTAISKDPTWLPGQKICLLSCSGVQHYIAIRDSAVAAAHCPLQLSSLRSMRMGGRHQQLSASGLFRSSHVLPRTHQLSIQFFCRLSPRLLQRVIGKMRQINWLYRIALWLHERHAGIRC